MQLSEFAEGVNDPPHPIGYKFNLKPTTISDTTDQRISLGNATDMWIPGKYENRDTNKTGLP
jgi:hypothetical protein